MEAFFKSDVYMYMILIGFILVFILYIINTVKLSKLRKEYKQFMTRLGKGDNLDEMLKTYIDCVDSVQKENKEIENYCKRLDEKTDNCIQRIGIVRYNSFKDTGSDLSFTLALLDEKYNGIVLNGIYSREMSNIYAKPVENGKSKYTLSEEEKEAIQKAIENE